MSLKLECHSNWNFTQIGMSLQLECHSNQNVSNNDPILDTRISSVRPSPPSRSYYPPPWFLKWAWLESSGRSFISLVGKTKRKDFFFGDKIYFQNSDVLKKSDFFSSESEVFRFSYCWLFKKDLFIFLGFNEFLLYFFVVEFLNILGLFFLFVKFQILDFLKFLEGYYWTSKMA